MEGRSFEGRGREGDDVIEGRGQGGRRGRRRQSQGMGLTS